MMLCHTSELSLHLFGFVNEHSIRRKARRSSIFSQSDRSVPSSKAFNAANTVGVLGGVSALSTLNFLEKLVKWQENLPFVACNDPILSKELSSCKRSASPYLSSRTTPYRYNESFIIENMRRKRNFLESSGARCIVMPCHISHVWYDEISQNCSLPFFHIGDCVANELKEADLKPVETGSNLRIGVLATEAVLNSRYYQNKLEEQGFEVMLLDRATMEHTVFPAIEAITKKDMEGAQNLLRIALQLLLVRAVNTVIIASSEFQGILPSDDPLLSKCTDPIDSLVRYTIHWAKLIEEKG